MRTTIKSHCSDLVVTEIKETVYDPKFPILNLKDPGK